MIVKSSARVGYMYLNAILAQDGGNLNKSIFESPNARDLVLFIFLLHPIDNTLVFQYQLIQSCLNYVNIIIIIIIIIIIKEEKLEWRREHYSKTNHGPLTRLTID